MDEDIETEIKQMIEDKLNEQASDFIYYNDRFFASVFMKNFFLDYFIDIYSIKNSQEFLESALKDTISEIEKLPKDVEPSLEIMNCLVYATQKKQFDLDDYELALDYSSSVPELQEVISNFLDTMYATEIKYIFETLQ